jgi:preprotein translocase subunit SecF
MVLALIIALGLNQKIRGLGFFRTVYYLPVVNQTLVRSINTMMVAILPVGAILFIGAGLLGAGTLRDLSLALFVGILIGTAATIFVAAPMYAWLRQGEPDLVKQARRVEQRRAGAAERAVPASPAKA